ncbi:hypothetical protein JKP88DRAFT_246960 [Tribonema minus]|uniref:Uncharacterized protein n=1 Tax=Tribonema minus TaxID=303371 RepID=A0A835YS05_9STRA|nr:hypothetical protein JKP88DRAFT_246960 [Tribonema minus]
MALSTLTPPSYLLATATTYPSVVPVGMPSLWRTKDLYKTFSSDAGATLATVKVKIGSRADALDLSAAVVGTRGRQRLHLHAEGRVLLHSILPVADRHCVFPMPEDITPQHLPMFHAGRDVMDNRRHLMLPITFEGRDAQAGLLCAADTPAKPLRRVSYLTHCIMVDNLPAALVLGNSCFVRNCMQVPSVRVNVDAVAHEGRVANHQCYGQAVHDDAVRQVATPTEQLCRRVGSAWHVGLSISPLECGRAHEVATVVRAAAASVTVEDGEVLGSGVLSHEEQARAIGNAEHAQGRPRPPAFRCRHCRRRCRRRQLQDLVRRLRCRS